MLRQIYKLKLFLEMLKSRHKEKRREKRSTIPNAKLSGMAVIFDELMVKCKCDEGHYRRLSRVSLFKLIFFDNISHVDTQGIINTENKMIVTFSYNIFAKLCVTGKFPNYEKDNK